MRVLFAIALLAAAACGGGATHQVDACHVRDVMCDGAAAACAATEQHCHPGD